jgi:hypothetical protein
MIGIRRRIIRHVRWRVVTTAVIVRTERLKGWGTFRINHTSITYTIKWQ